MTPGGATANGAGRITTSTLQLFGRPVIACHARIRPPAGLAAGPGLRLLSDEEQERCAGIEMPAGQLEFVAGRVLARRTLGRILGLPARRVPLVLDDSGRPRLAGRDGRRRALDFNLSHSGDRVALAVGWGVRVGVDIELRVPRPAADALARRYFSSAENDYLRRRPDARYRERWYRIWTTREANAKARGIGVRGIAAPLDGHGHAWQRRHLALPAAYAGTVVGLAPTTTIAPIERTRSDG
ncbi:4'-phosphopantetheinyl transferase [Jatrophihabitans endophyticus]|uniref:4'-phosphopantetheinyl transferase n=1 Tax=Jatrophihabitans endophyticus TaxID=1206085 RepID=A0A1M5RE51_9ACTN|nr:4'-phosphopantetheinyl transferase superfamily protein [Jatrophihabitans endophyticus]SHH24299.1 4'-phosphopantetheinyl transferase [Jatrophihabitans endophyticus]